MTLERKIAAAFNINEITWMRHANPWSVWTRNTALPLLISCHAFNLFVLRAGEQGSRGQGSFLRGFDTFFLT